MQFLLFILVLVAGAGEAFPQALPPLTGPWTFYQNVQYGNAGQIPLQLDLYVPDGPGPFPVVIYVHGGGWVAGTKDLRANPVFAEPAYRGYAVASVEYRFSQVAKFPAQIEDVKTAVRWLRANAANYNLDPSRFAAWGESAGGHLVSLLGVSAGIAFLEDLSEGSPELSSSVEGVIDWYGPVDFTTIAQQAAPCSTYDHNSPTSPEGLLLGCSLLACPDKARAASPTTYVRQGMPPFLIMHGAADCTVPSAQSQEFHDLLARAGADVTLVFEQGAGHGGDAFFEPDPGKLIRVDSFLDRVLRGWSTISVSAASYGAHNLAAGSIATAFGDDLAIRTASTPTVKLPTSLGGTQVSVLDSAGITRATPLFYVSPNQVNYLLPDGTAMGGALVTVTSADRTATQSGVIVTPTSPGLFSAFGNGGGFAAAQVIRVIQNQITYEPVVALVQQQLVATPIHLDQQPAFLALYGTGIRYRSALSAVSANIGGINVRVTYAGAQGTFAGLDQVNVSLPAELAGRGLVDIVLTVDGQQANTLQILFY